jgi:hypothetical protein
MISNGDIMENANLEESVRALENAKELIHKNNYKKALKLLQISNRLHFTIETQNLINEVESKIILNDSQPNNRNTHGNNNANNNTSQSNNPSHNNSSTNYITQLFNSLINSILTFENKYIRKDAKIYIRSLFAVIVVLLIVKFGFQKPITFGLLPGDINYSSSTTYVSFPIVSCLLVSLLFNAINHTCF